MAGKSGAQRQAEYHTRRREKIELLEAMLRDFVNLHAGVEQIPITRRDGRRAMALRLVLKAPESTKQALEKYCQLNRESTQQYLDRVAFDLINEAAFELRAQHREAQS